MINKINNIDKQIPLLIPSISILLGIFYSYCYKLNNIILAITILCLSLFLIKNNKYKSSKFFCNTILFLSGIFLANIQKNTFYYQINYLKNKTIKSTAYVIDKQPQENKAGEILTLQLRKIKIIKNKYKKFSPIRNIIIKCYTQQTSSIQIGNTIKINYLKIPGYFASKNITNKPNYNDYQIKEHVLCSVFCKKLYYKIKNKNKFNIIYAIDKLKKRISNTIKQKLPNKTFQYFSYIFLGNKKNKQNKDIKKIFQTWGITHYLSRSGLHVILFILIWQMLLQLIPIGIIFKKTLLLTICMSYSLLSWPSLSFYRALYVFVFYETGNLLHKQASFLHLLFLLCITTLLFNPIQASFLDFQLSFGLALALGILNKAK